MAEQNDKALKGQQLKTYTGYVKRAIAQAQTAATVAAVTDIAGDGTTPSYDSDVNATAVSRSISYTKNGTTAAAGYKDTTYGQASATKDGLMSHEDKSKLDGIATGAESNVQSDWNQTTTTADDYIKNKPVVNKVRQTQKTDDASYNMVMTDIASSGIDDELEYTSQVVHNPSTRVTTFHTTSGASSVDVKIENGGVTMGAGTINATSYSGTAAKATADADGNIISTTYAKLDDLAADDPASRGAALIGYDATTVADALDDIYDTLGGSGGSSVMDLIEDLQDGENLIEGTNITLTKDTTNHAVTIAASDKEVKQNKKTANTNYYVLLSTDDSSANIITGEASFSSILKLNPYTKKMMLTSSYEEGSGALATTYDTQIDLGESGLTITKSQAGTTVATGTLTATSYSGNAATATNATNDGNGLNIATNYALKSEILLPTPIIVSSLPSTVSDEHKGKFIFIKDSGASTDTRNVFTEYIAVQDNGTWKYERIGSTEVNLDLDFLTNDDIDDIWTNTAAAS